MTAVAERKVEAEAAYYEVQYPATGEVLAYVVAATGRLPGPLGQAFADNGLRIVPVHAGLSAFRLPQFGA